MENKSTNNSLMVIDLNENFDNLFYYTRQININSTILITLIGLIGHSLTLFVYIQPKFRINSSNIFMICLALNDSIYLIVHLFEDTIRTIIDLHPDDVSEFILFLNFVDRHNLACYCINYLRNVLRFISAYIIVAFTLQRLYIVYKPLSDRFKSKSSAWLTFFLIVFASLVFNAWTLFIFEIKKTGLNRYCDIKREFSRVYLILNITYMLVVMIIPITMIFISNILIIVKSNRDDCKRGTLMQSKALEETSNMITTRYSINRNSNLFINKINSNQTNLNSLNSRNELNKLSYSKRLTKLLLIVSFTYSLFNLPYAVSWSLFFSFLKLNETNLEENSGLFSVVQLCEVPTVINHGINFFLYCLSGSLFRSQLKCLFKRALFGNSENKRCKYKLKMELNYK